MEGGGGEKGDVGGAGAAEVPGPVGGLCGPEPGSAGRILGPKLVFPPKEERRERVENFRESSLPDNGTLKQVSKLFERLFLGQKTLSAFWKPQESCFAV